MQWPELGGNQEQLGWLEPQAQGTERQAVSRRGPGSEACGNVRRRRESEGRKVEEQKSKLRCFLGGILGMVWDWRGREEQACVRFKDWRRGEDEEYLSNEQARR